MCIEFKNSDEEGAKPVKVSQVHKGTQQSRGIGRCIGSPHHHGTFYMSVIEGGAIQFICVRFLKTYLI